MINAKTGLITLSAAVFAAGAVSAQTPAGGPPAGPPGMEMPPAQQAVPQVSPEVLIETFGYIVGVQSNVSSYGLNEEEMELFLKGFHRANKGEAVPPNIQQMIPQLEAFLGSRQQSVAEGQAQENRLRADAYFANLDEREGVEQTESGLRYEVTREGRGDAPELSDTVRIHYEGKLMDGTVFDSSRANGEAVEFPLAGVIPGMSEGLTKVREGGSITLHIPPELGYGNERQPGIPPGSVLVFDVELVEVSETPPPQQQQPQIQMPPPQP